jgi:hypothetical protein
VDLLKVASLGDGFAVAVLIARSDEPAASVEQPAGLTARLAGASRTRFRQVDSFVDLGLGFLRQGALPVETRRPVLFLDLGEFERTAVGLDCRPDPSAGALQQSRHPWPHSG